MQLLAAADFGSTYTKLAAIDPVGRKVLATAHAPSTVETDVNEGFDQALALLKDRLGARGGDIGRFVASSSAAGGLRIAAIGLVPSLTAEAAKRAALCAGGKVLLVLSNRITRAEIAQLEALKPEILLLVGGTDGGNSTVVLHNARMIAASSLSAPVLYAGNKSVQDEVQALMDTAGKEIFTCENVMPQVGVLNIEPARAVIREIFLKRIVEAKGIARVRGRVGEILMPTPTAVLQAAQLLADGCPGEAGAGDLVVFDIGGATTDVHSVGTGAPSRTEWIARGLPEPYAKRTVEGDLGLRWSAESVLEAAGLSRLQERMGDRELDIPARARCLAKHPDTVPSSEAEHAFDLALAAVSVDLAMERHAGRLEVVHGLDGSATLLHGKDLSSVGLIIGVGGVFSKGQAGHGVLGAALASPATPLSTRPRDAATAVDKDYVFFAAGLLATEEPQLCLHLLKHHLHRCNPP